MTIQYRTTAAAVQIITMLTITSQAYAFNFGAGSMTTWSACDDPCDGVGGLTYTHQQIDYLISRLENAGHTNKFWFMNSENWSTDVVEDGLNGQDHSYSDKYTLYAFSGHGNAYTDNNGKQHFELPMCDSNGYEDCFPDSKDIRFGEKSGSYATPYEGKARYVVWATCYSVHTAPNEQWGSTFIRGTDMIFGYRGLSADSDTTDEVLGDFADASFGGSDTFKAGWFWAIEDLKDPRRFSRNIRNLGIHPVRCGLSAHGQTSTIGTPRVT